MFVLINCTRTSKETIIQNVANVLTGRNSAQCRVGRANYNESKTIRKATCFVVTPSFTLYSDHQTTECSAQISFLIYKSMLKGCHYCIITHSLLIFACGLI